MTDSQQPRVGFVGFGEAASCFATGFSKNGLQSIDVYCNGPRNHPPYTEAFHRSVRAAGATAVDSLEELVQRSDVVFSAVLVASATDVGRAIASRLHSGQLLVDINASPPTSKRRVAAAATEAGADYVDANLMGAVSIYGHSVELYSSGSGAARLAELLGPFGLNVTIAGPDAGMSALVKMLRSVVTKGMEALIIEAMTTAELAGITSEAFRAICDPMDATTYSAFADMCIKTDVLHSGRRAVEMAEVLDELQGMGVKPVMTTATVQRLRMSERLGLRDRFVDAPPRTFQDVLEAYAGVMQGSDPDSRQRSGS